jgi:hypothetical protein
MQDSSTSLVAAYQQVEGAMMAYFDMVDEALDGGIINGITEYQFNKLGLPEHLFNVERRRDLRRNLVVHIYILKDEHQMDLAIIRQMHKELVSESN